MQTEFGTYHLNWSENSKVPKGYSVRALIGSPGVRGLRGLSAQEVWPSRDELLKHYEEAVDEEGIRPVR